jgi:hypothetical protein
VNPFWLILISALVLVAIFRLNDRVLLPWRTRRKVEKIMRDIREGKSKPPCFDRTILFDDAGFGVRSENALDQAAHMPWGEVAWVTAYKRDLFSTDLICVFLSRTDGTGLEVHEEMNNWMDFIFSLPKHLRGCKGAESWFQDIAVPAFEPKVTELFSRSTEVVIRRE